MSRIVYGVSGEGSGHSSRASVVISHLERSGHQVKVVSYDRGYENLKDAHDVFKTEGLHIASRDNKISFSGTIADNFSRLPEGRRKLKELKSLLFKEFNPDCVITDFEPMTAYLAQVYKIPLVTIDNQHRMRYMEYPHPPGLGNERRVTESVIRAMVPKPDISLVTSFFFGVPQNDRTFIFPPILRDEVLELEFQAGDHVLVYLTSGFDSLLDCLKEFKRERFIVYGYGRDDTDGALQFKKPSRDGFLEDLATCKAVMATAGFTLMTEAFYLKKPYLALPMKGQFEQELNAYLLERLNYGVCARNISEEIIGNFLYHLPDFQGHLDQYRAEDNSRILNKLDELLADDCRSLVKRKD